MIPTMSAKKLADAVTERRVSVGHRTRRSLAAAAGLSERVVQSIEMGEKPNYRPATLVALDRALGWAIGSSERVLHKGDAPIVLEDTSEAGATVDPMLIDAGDVIEDLSPAELMEARAAATVAFLERVREIRSKGTGGGDPLR